MVFQSLNFLIFFTLFFFVYWALSSQVRIRNGILLIVSFWLYSLWDIRFTMILAGMILVNYFFGRYASNSSSKGKAVFYICLTLNLIPLAFFKYYNFFAESINNLFSLTGASFNLTTLQLLLPLGISFYTFLSLSYLIDVYKKYIQPENNLINYALSISYFPIILSGPIHRPRIFLDQLKKEKKFDHDLAVEGLRQILTGLFYKVVIADTIAKYVNAVFDGYDSMNGLTVFAGSIYFSFQLYFDFNGYSEMAIGISKLLGFRIKRNFKFPYLSRTIADFWKRWHISLTEWFRDYVFLPLSYIVSRKIRPGSALDSDIFIYSIGIFVTWTLTGLWHGAGWNFILWGMIHAALLIINKGFFKKKKKLLKKFSLKKDSYIIVAYESIITFLMVNFAWVFFRAETVPQAFEMIKKIFFVANWGSPQIALIPLIIIASVLIMEFVQRKREFLFEVTGYNAFFRWSLYLFATVLVLYFSGNEKAFIYMGF